MPDTLLLSPWPLLDEAGQPIGKSGGPMPLGVLDLVKVAAIPGSRDRGAKSAAKQVIVIV